MVANVLYPSKKGKNDPEGDSETFRAVTATTGPGSKVASVSVSKTRALEDSLKRGATLESTERYCCCPCGPEGRAWNQKVILQHSYQMDWRTSRRQRTKTWRSPSSPQIHQEYIYMWNNSYRTPVEH